jgi:hypothetical protein
MFMILMGHALLRAIWKAGNVVRPCRAETFHA